MRIWFQLPRPGIEPIINRTCPACGHRKMHIHEHQRFRRIVDWKLDTIQQVRVKCPCCGQDWHVPAGGDQGRASPDRCGGGLRDSALFFRAVV